MFYKGKALYWNPKAPGSCYYALLGSPFPSKSCLRVHSSMKAEPLEEVPRLDTCCIARYFKFSYVIMTAFWDPFF